MPHPSIQIIPLAELPEIGPGDDLSRLIVEAVNRQDLRISEGDIFVVAQKIVSKAEGKIVRLDSIQPSKRAEQWAAEYQKDARVIELVLGEASRIVRMERGDCRRDAPRFCAPTRGRDVSNAPEGHGDLAPGRCRRSARAANTTQEGLASTSPSSADSFWASLAEGWSTSRSAAGNRAPGGLSR